MCQLETVSRLEQAAAQALGCDVEDVVKESYDHYGLKIYSYAHLEYAVGTDEEADQAAAEDIKQSLWAFNASFIIDHSKLEYSADIEKCLKEMQAQEWLKNNSKFSLWEWLYNSISPNKHQRIYR